MNRRSFLRMLVGGVAASAAVRTWPFRVYSFPTNLELPKPFPVVPADAFAYVNRLREVTEQLTGMHYYQVMPEYIGPYMGISRELDIAEAKRLFPGPFHWQDKDRVRYSVLQPDGSVVDA